MIAIAAIIAGSLWALSATGFFTRQAEELHKNFIASSAEHGFIVKKLMVEGRGNLSRTGLKTLLNINQNDPLYAHDLNELQAKVQSLTWVKSAIVQRRLPDTLYIKIIEREPIALWQRARTLSVVDDEGVVLTDYNIQKFKNLIVVVGDNAPQNTRDLLSILNAVPTIKARVDAAKWIGNRRWDLTLNNKIIIRLPSDNSLDALKKLETLHANDLVLDRPLTSIDLRDTGRIIVQTTPGDADKIEKNLVTDIPKNDKDI